MVEIEPGVRVVYSARFLHSLAVSGTDPKWSAKGLVVSVADEPLLAVLWDGTPEPQHVNRANLLPENRTVTAEEAPFECGNAWGGQGFRPLY